MTSAAGPKPANGIWQTRSSGAAMLGTVLLAVCLANLAKAAEQILAFDSTIVVRDDGVLDVTETIRVRAEGDQIKRGIFRDFPLTFSDDAGKRHRVDFRLLEVTRNGRSEPYHTRRNSDGVRIYLGEEDIFLPDGVYTYTLHYESGRQIRFLPGQSELFWNVTGNDWAFPILSATALIKLPDSSAPDRWTAYTGDRGERGEDFTGRILSDNALGISTSRILKPGQGLSVVVEIPAGLVAPPSGTTALYHWYLDNLKFIFGGFGFLGVFVFYVGAWRAVGRDPPKGTIIPLFYPPEGISPALAGYVHNWGWRDTWRDFTAAAISLAVKGVLVFDDFHEKIVFSTADNKDQQVLTDLAPGERAILKWVDTHGGHVAIDKATGKSLAKLLKSFKNSIEGENRHRFFKRNIGFFIVGLVLTFVALVLVLIFGDLSDSEIGLLAVVWFVGLFVGIFLMSIIRTIGGARNVRSIVVAGVNIVALAVFGVIFSSVAVSSYTPLPDDFGRTVLAFFLENGFPFVLVGGFAVMNGLFYYLLRAPTAAGRKVMDEIEGLELYIRTAETPRLNAVGAPDFTTDHFERLLPYAIALGAEEPWSEAFATAFARAHIGETAETSYRPIWHGGRGWNDGSFTNSISSSVSAAQRSFSSAIPARSSSSGFSGGGSSGGGGGGGGGGW